VPACRVTELTLPTRCCHSTFEREWPVCSDERSFSLGGRTHAIGQEATPMTQVQDLTPMPAYRRPMASVGCAPRAESSHSLAAQRLLAQLLVVGG